MGTVKLTVTVEGRTGGGGGGGGRDLHFSVGPVIPLVSSRATNDTDKLNGEKRKMR